MLYTSMPLVPLSACSESIQQQQQHQDEEEEEPMNRISSYKLASMYNATL